MKLYVVPGSHPCAAVMKALELKGIAYKRIDLLPAFHKLFMSVKFGRPGTVPGIVLDDGRKVHGSRAILRALDELKPEPPLYPTADEADQWGDEVFQPVVRRLIWMALTHKPKAQVSLLGDAKLFPPTPLFLAGVTARPLAWFERRINHTTPEAVAADLQALPAHLDRIDGWLADGTLGGETAADLQIAPSIRLLAVIDDLKPLIEPRPANAWATRLFPSYPGHVPAGALEVPAAT